MRLPIISYKAVTNSYKMVTMINSYKVVTKCYQIVIYLTKRPFCRLGYKMVTNSCNNVAHLAKHTFGHLGYKIVTNYCYKKNKKIIKKLLTTRACYGIMELAPYRKSDKQVSTME